MKKKHFFWSISIVLFTFLACSDKDDELQKTSYKFVNTTPIETINIKSYDTLDMSTGQPSYIGFTKVKFVANEKAQIVTGDSWDIAFNGSSIYLNTGENVTIGGIELVKTANVAYYITDGTLENTTTVDFDAFLEKQMIERKDWGVYNFTTHIVSPIVGKIIVLRTHDNNYVKFRIDSYYKDKIDITSPQNAALHFGYFTLTHIYN